MNLSVCDTCGDSNRSNTPNCGCDVGYVDDGSNATCLKCNYKCGSCSDPTDLGKCDSCSDSNRSSTPDCDCDSGFVDYGVGTCSSCTITNCIVCN